MKRLVEPWLRIEAVEQPGRAARAYVPVALVNRGLAAVRLIVVAQLLGKSGQAVFGQYQLALESINWLVPLALFGLADVAERYVADYQRHGQLLALLRWQAIRIAFTAMTILVVLAAIAPWVGSLLLVLLVGVNVGILAGYQWVAGVLRGMRAYRAAAGMETAGALFLLLFAAAASWLGTTPGLLVAYAAANLLPVLWFGNAIRHAALANKPTLEITPDAPALKARLGWFGGWVLIRLLLTMTFGLIAISALRWLTLKSGAPAKTADSAAGEYAMPYRIAQMLAFGGVTLWASSYAIIARTWAQGSRRRATVQLFRLGRLGGVALLAAAAVAILLRGLVIAVLPSAYSTAIDNQLAPWLGVFLWYAMLGFFVVYGDVQEKPWIGAILWALAVLIQGGIILAASRLNNGAETSTAGFTVVWASAAGVGLSCLLVAPLLLWRPMTMSATAVPIGIILACTASFFSPSWVVGTLAPGVVAVGIAFLWFSGLLRIRRKPKYLPEPTPA